MVSANKIEILRIAETVAQEKMIDKSRTPEIMGDAAYAIFCSDSKRNTGNFWVDDEVLVSVGTRDFSKYRVNQDTPEHELIPDFFV